MLEIKYTIGETRTWRVRLKDADGSAPNLSGATAQVRLTLPDQTCHVVTGAPDADPSLGVGFRLSPATLDLTEGRYNGGFWVSWPGGDEICYSRLRLAVERGC